jgi:hypothetical protein
LDGRSGNVTLALSNRFVRYVVTPWQDQVAGTNMEVAFAQHRFRQVYGAAAEHWEVRVSPGRAGRPRVASAVDRELLNELRAAFRPSRLKVWSIQPHLMAAYNKWRRKLDARACIFIVVEDRFYTCMVFVDGECGAVHSGVFEGTLADALPIILDREFVRSGLEERPAIFIYAPDQPPIVVDDLSGWGDKTLYLRDETGIAAAVDPVYRTAVMAM